jgi:hypothetical protein
MQEQQPESMPPHVAASVQNLLAVAEASRRRVKPSPPLGLSRTIATVQRAPKPGGSCPQGFTEVSTATWFRCGESKGTQNLACAVKSPGKKPDSNCSHIVKAVGHQIIAPPGDMNARCGAGFEITTPERAAQGDDALEALKAEVPNKTPLDIHKDMIPDLGLDVSAGHYVVCLKATGAHDNRLVSSPD